MHIDSYQFGRIVIDGVGYNGDLIIVGETVDDDWRRARGHSVSIDDLATVIEAKPSILVVGCGAYGVMKVPEETHKALLEFNIQVEALKTGKAVERFNDLRQAGESVAAALHLTC